MLAGALEDTGEPGAPALEGRFTPFRNASGVLLWLAFVVVGDAAAVLVVSDGSSSMGEGRGGGMLVPSVKEPNWRSRAGSWNLGAPLAVLLPLARDGMMARQVG